MKRAIILVVILLFSMVSWAAAEEGNFNVGPFQKGKPFLSSDLKQQVVTGMARIPQGASVRIVGHTDSSGSPSFNQRLATWRAQEVAEEIRDIAPKIEVKEVVGEPFQGKSEGINYRIVRVVLSGSSSGGGSTPTSKTKQNKDKKAKASLSPEVLKHTDRISRQIRELESKLDKLRQESTLTGEQFSSMEKQIEKDIRILIQEANQKDQNRLKEIQATLKQIKLERKQEYSFGFWVLLIVMIMGILVLIGLAVAGYLFFGNKIDQEANFIKDGIDYRVTCIMEGIRENKNQISQDIEERTAEAKTFFDSSLGERVEQIEQRIEEADAKTEDLSRGLNAKLDELKSIGLTPQEEQTLREEWVKVNSHQVKVQVTSDRIFLPFISSHGDRMYRSSWRDVKKALKGALKKESFAGQVEQLKQEGKIIENKEEEK